MSRYTYDYYTIAVPGDADDSLESLAGLAIDVAVEGARLYCVPAVWTAEHVSGEVGDWEVTFRVRRKRNRTA